MKKGWRLWFAMGALVAAAGCNALLAIEEHELATVDGGDSPSADGDDGLNDGGDAPDASVARCDPTKPFGTPVQLTEISSPDGGGENMPHLTADERTLYFATAQSPSDIYVATRDAPGALFGAPARVDAVDTEHTENSPSLTADELELFLASFATQRTGIVYSTRANRGAPWGTPVEITLPDGAPRVDMPFISADGRTLYAAMRVGDSGMLHELRKSAVSPTAPNFGPLESIGVDTLFDETRPILSADERTIYFASNRDAGTGGLDIWTARRLSKLLHFGTPTNVRELNTTSHERPGWVSGDGCVIYFSSMRSGSVEHVFRAQRPN
jgi:hypothetical protein